MHMSIIDLIPKDAVIEEYDIRHLFYRYIKENNCDVGVAVHHFITAMQEVLDEEFDTTCVVSYEYKGE
jgi:hypothetical protein